MAFVTSSDPPSITIEISHDEDFSEGDFVTLEETGYVVQITDMKTDGGSFVGKGTVIGTQPNQPIPEGTDIQHADPSQIKAALGLPPSGAHIGDIRGLDTEIALDIDALMQKQIGIFGRTGSGKSYTAGVFIEELLTYDCPVIIIDRHGEYAGLQLTREGNPSDYRVVQYADREFVPEAEHKLDFDTINVEDLARPGQATIINLLGFDDQEEFVAELLEFLLLKRKREQIPATKIVIEEAHAYATSTKTPAREVIERVAKEGRKFGLTMGIVSQRPSGIYTNVRTQIQTVLLHKLTDNTDVEKAIDITEGIDLSWKSQIRTLNTGECIVAGDLLASPTFVDVRQRQTMHDGGEGDSIFEATGQVVDPEAVKQRQADLDEQVEDATVEELREHVKRLSSRQDATLSDINEADPTDRESQLEKKINERENNISQLREYIREKEKKIEKLESKLEEKRSTQAENLSQTKSNEKETELQERVSHHPTSGNKKHTESSEAKNRQEAPVQESDPAREPDDEESDKISKLPKDNKPPRRPETVLKLEIVQNIISGFEEEIETLSLREKRALRYFMREGSGKPADAVGTLTLDSDSPTAEEIIESIESAGFVAADPSIDKYQYILPDRIYHRLSDVLHEEEIKYVINEIESRL